jgi:hypothetical protein
MEKLEVYKDSDGNLHDDYEKAILAQADIIGLALDTLIGDTDHGMTSVCRTRMMLNTLKSKDFKAKVIALCNAVKSEDWEELQHCLIRYKWFD